MKQLLAKIDSLTANSYAPGLFTFFSDTARISELEHYAKANLPPTAAKSVAKAIDEVGFRAEFKPRLATQIADMARSSREKLEVARSRGCVDNACPRWNATPGRVAKPKAQPNLNASQERYRSSSGGADEFKTK